MLRPQEYRNCLFGNTLTRIGIGVLASAVFTLLIVSPRPRHGNVVLDANGNVFGTTSLGGNSGCGSGCGVIFEIAP